MSCSPFRDDKSFADWRPWVPMLALLSLLTGMMPQMACARQITDDLGRSVEVPDHPQRIVSLHDIDLTIPLIELGVMPIASQGRMGLDGHPYLRAGKLLTGVDFDTAPIRYIGSIDVDLEAIAALKPDLIVTAPSRPTPIDALQGIAPTVVLDAATRGGPHVYRQLASLTGTKARLAQLEHRYRAGIESLKKLVDTASITVSVIQPLSGKISVYQSYRALGQVLHDAGFRFPPLITRLDPGQRIDVGAERLPDIDADYIFDPYRSDRGTGARADIDAMNAIMPGFCRFLKACRSGHYVMVARDEAISNSYAALALMTAMVQAEVTRRPTVIRAPNPTR